MFPITKDRLEASISNLAIADVTTATIRQICSLAAGLEEEAQEKFVHLEIGNPGLPAINIGVEAECAALQSGIANQYPNIGGIPALKDNGSKFLKAFLDIDVPGRCIVPTVGSMQGSFTVLMLMAQRDPKKDSIVFINPGFPATHNQAKILGLKDESFDIYEYRGKKLEDKLESILSKGNVTALIYSNPNNPAWTNLTEEELEIIGRMATKHDVIVLEDLAYLGMDFRQEMGKPYEAPYVPTVAKYTDNYILFVSASKIFSYAGQRIAMVCMSPAVYDRKYEFFEKFYEMPALGDAYIFGILYTASSGTAHSAQYAMAAMMGAAIEGKLNFIEECREYARRGEITRKMFLDNGFHIIYDIDGDKPISDGFFFTAGYKDLTGGELQKELMRYGISSISLHCTGSDQEGIRVCVSMLNNDETFAALNDRLKAFNADH
ncbi:MAG: pyridoxal phosphate-dependent aminotransferase [Muribaculaceae bacterium]|jgi:aspartate/methionine/tyrosine aminotransferase|nr:pyridoxal phosphate-dependent aminotransferase [Muribaculaceae bacterium]MBQ2398915.1 pyridoxal phosphate-dependent aminotransferase [Muribaculaceae bacterium]MBQ2439976.1 pyridoxal phosphate-dependent aminotransferase [Muribaculaceae bacterium]MBQ5723460.1 pyridoxal phosphate-dependent aminotransferase [Muribaculaceae bacterium]